MTLTTRLDQYLRAESLESVWFAKPNSFAWLTGGGNNVVDRDSTIGIAAAGYDGTRVRVVTDTIEAPRLATEELDDTIEVESYPWYEQTLAAAVADTASTPAAADFTVPGFATIEPGALRQPLTPDQLAAYRALAGTVAEAVETAGRTAKATDTELEVAATIRRLLERHNISTPVVLVGGSERAQAYRHYTPTTAELGAYALISVTAARDGLYASCSRTIAFDAPPWLPDRTHDAMRVETTALAATQAAGTADGTAGDVFAAIQAAYDAVGWDDEWRYHHQGGAAGYAGREWIATPDHSAPVVLPMAYSWNPTIQGAKSEDLHLVTADSIEPLTVTGDWPTREVTAVNDSLTLARPAVLER